MNIFYLAISCVLIYAGFFCLLFPQLLIFTTFLASLKNLIFFSLCFLRTPSISLSLVVLMITFCVMLFSCYYMKEEKYLIYFIFMVLLFVISMLLLSLSNSIFLIFLGWDGLGITSYLLIMFYINWKSMNNSVFTLLSNRVGDGLILLFFGQILWEFYGGACTSFSMSICSILLIFVFMTKSAQVPVSAWLPAAMAAPTPVSALVHSSTLVTAGIVLLMKFYFLLSVSSTQKLLFFIGMLTIFIAGLSALMEMDFKKLVALSTLSQMGMLVFILGLGTKWLSLFHLISHAFFKSCLFLVVGGVLHFLFTKQDWRSYTYLGGVSFSQMMYMYLCCMCLCGLFFTSGFISKDFVLDFFSSKKSGSILLFCFLVSLFLTFVYCFRMFLCFYKLSGGGNKTWFYKHSGAMEQSPFILVSFSLTFCFWGSYNNGFYFSALLLEKKMLLLIILFLFVGLMVSLLSSFLKKSMFLLDIFYKASQFLVLKGGGIFEKTMLDFLLISLSSQTTSKMSILNIFNSLSKELGFFMFVAALILGVVFF